jgi:type II secretory pathway component PulM
MRAWYNNLSERDRRIVMYGGIVVVILIILGTVLPLNRSITQAQQRVTVKQGDLAFIQGAVPQLAAAGPAGGALGGGDSFIAFVDSSARESGIGKSLASSQPTGEKGLRVRFERVAFDGLVAWLARLAQNHGVSVESAEIESAGEAGLVNAGLVLRAG